MGNWAWKFAHFGLRNKMVTENLYSLVVLAFIGSLVPLFVAAGTCFLKISIVFSLVRNALGVQQVPSNMTLNGIALFMSMFVMLPIIQQGYDHYRSQNIQLESVESIIKFSDTGLDGYRAYLKKYSDPELVDFFEKAQAGRLG